MKKYLLWTGAAFGALLLVVSALAAYVVFILDPNDYKSQLAALVKHKTDMDLTLDGHLSWQLYPDIGINLGSTTLTNPVLKENLAAIKSVSVSVELLPLLTRKIHINAIDLDTAELRLVQYADGTTSWDHLLEKLKTPDDKESTRVALAIKGLTIKNSHLTAVDAVSHASRELQKVSVTAKDIDLAKEFPIETSFLFAQTDAIGRTLLASNTVKTGIKLDLDAKKYLFNELDISTHVSGTALPAPAQIELKSAQIAADMSSRKIDIPALELSLSYLDKGRPEPITIDLKTGLAVDLAASAATLSGLHINGVIADSSLPKSLPVSLSAAVAANWKAGQFVLSQLVVQAANMHLTGSLSAALPAMATGAKPITQGMKVNGNIAVASFDPRQLLAALGKTAPVTRSPAVLHKVMLNADISGDAQQFMATNLRLTLDGSTITGSAGVRELPAARLVAQLATDAINVDDYLPPSAPVKPATDTVKASLQKAATALLPVDLLRKQNIDVVLSAGKLTAITYPISNFRVAATARGGLVQVSDLRGSIGKGSFSSPMTIDVRGPRPLIAITPILKDIDLGPLAQKALKKDIFAGRLNFQGKVQMSGNDADSWLRTAQGPNTLRLDQGVIKGVNVVDALFAALGRYQVLLPALTGRDNDTLKGKVYDTEILSALGDMTMSQGVVNNTSMKADLNSIQVGGNGQYNILTQDLDYRFQLKLDKKYWGTKYARMADYPIPVHCNGNLKGSVATLCGLDQQAMPAFLAQLAQSRFSDQIDEQKGKLQDKLNQKLNPQQQEAVKKLFDLFTPH